VLEIETEFYKGIRIKGQTITGDEYQSDCIQSLIKNTKNVNDFVNKLVVYKI
jgi:gamma-glutamylcysteine synthetase